ncbi:MAG TPA: response regulator transcription factor [Gaiellaceae bacterium]|nr:response regulator transcription factor [Gaiellaceae bacterium]
MRVLLADDHALFRAGIASLLGLWGLEVVGQAATGEEAVELARRLHPDLVLMDITMPGCGGLEATRLIKTELPETRVIVVTVSADDDDLFEAIKSGAEGYLLKATSEEELSRALTKIAAGQPAFSADLAERILEEYARVVRDGPTKDDADDLSARERDVLVLVAGGATNREIAAKLFISQNTVEFHMRNILAKLHAANRTQAAAHAIRAGLVEFRPS